MPATDADIALPTGGGIAAPVPAASVTPAQPKLSDWLNIIVLSVIWGGSFAAIRAGLDSFGPFGIATLRITIAAMILLPIALLGPGLPRLNQRRVWLHAAGMAVFSNALPFTMLGWAEQHVASAFAGISMALVPLFTLALAIRFIPGERLTVPRIIGLMLGLLGVVVLIGPGALSGGGDQILARLACVAVTASYAVGAVITRRCPPVPMVSFSAAALAIAALLLWPVMLLAEGLPDLIGATRASLVGVAYLGVLPTAAATLVLVSIIQSAGPVFLSTSNYQVPVWSMIFGVSFFGEQLRPSFFLALFVILAGLMIGQRRWGARRAGPVDRAPG